MSKNVAARLAALKRRARAADMTLTNLASTLGVYEGLNDRLRRGNVADPGAHALSIVLFDLIHLIAIRTNALLIASKQKDDVTLQTFVDALHDRALCEAIVERVASDFACSDVRYRLPRTAKGSSTKQNSSRQAAYCDA
jgi:hypothetical protein